MSCANSETSPRLQKVLGVLRQAGINGATSLEIGRATGSVAPGTDISELRKGTNRYIIDCRYEGKTQNGRKVFRYFLLGRDEA